MLNLFRSHLTLCAVEQFRLDMPTVVRLPWMIAPAFQVPRRVSQDSGDALAIMQGGFRHACFPVNGFDEIIEIVSD